MSEPLLYLHFLLLLLLCCVSSSSTLLTTDDLVPCGPRQIEALTQFKNEFDFRNCSQTEYFNGVWCDNTTGAITKLILPNGCFNGILKPNSSLFGFHQLRFLGLSSNNFISSSLPFEFGNLQKLEVLVLSYNGFIGQIPSSFGNLSKLSVLDISHNELTGSIQLVCNLSKLTYLDVSNNHFSGTLKPTSSLFELRQLRILDLAFNNFHSSLLSEFGNLNRLETLSLTSSGFSGQVPPTISNLTQLTVLFLSENKLTGSFPLLQNLTKLTRLGLSDNHFTGSVPSSLFTLPSLSYLNLIGNGFTGSIEVPTSSRLEFLYLGKNHFEGKILESISKLITLKRLDLSYLNTSYPISFKFFSSLKSLVYINLSGNNIPTTSLKSDSYISKTLREMWLVQCNISEFPQFLKTLQKLEHIYLSGNIIKGKIPKWLWRLPRLTSVHLQVNYINGFEGSSESLVNSSVQVLRLDENRFEGAFPHLPLAIIAIYASYNSFNGEIPLSICNRRFLELLDLSYNFFTGSIPQCLSNLKFLSLQMNNLEGSIPNAFYVGASLQALNVGYNQLTGRLPRSLVNCSSLKFLTVNNNKIKDKFPFWLKASPNLQVLILNSNEFYGPISLPHQGPLGFLGLQIFEISGNKFTGSLPPDYFVNWKTPPPPSVYGDEALLYIISSKHYDGIYYYAFMNVVDMRYKGLSMEQTRVITSYATIDLSGNLLEGQIPESIGLLKALIALNLSNNAFSGHIPLSLANLKELESLDISKNKLSGTIPNGLKSLSFLAYINVSHNQLKGEIPQGTQITGQSKSSFEGNAGLCGLPLEESCLERPTQYHKKEEEEEDDEEEVLNWKGVVLGYGVGVLFGLVIAQVIASYKPEWVAKIIDVTKRKNR